MRIGIHTSSSPKLQNAAISALELGANCLQIFSASPRMWRAAPPPPDEVAEMKRIRQEHDLAPLVVHDSYLINLASSKDDVLAKSIQGFRGEVERALLIGADYLVMHPGSATGHPDLETALLRLAASLEQASRGLSSDSFTLLLENTAGGGSTIGRTLEELKTLRDMVSPRLPFRVGFCLDTCHLFASGFDIASPAGLAKVVQQIDQVLGIDNVPVIHANDSKGSFDSRLDRHAGIGEGNIGLEAFRRILNHPKLRSKAFILETPIDEPGDDKRNVDTLKSLAAARKARK